MYIKFPFPHRKTEKSCITGYSCILSGKILECPVIVEYYNLYSLPADYLMDIAVPVGWPDVRRFLFLAVLFMGRSGCCLYRRLGREVLPAV